MLHRTISAAFVFSIIIAIPLVDVSAQTTVKNSAATTDPPSITNSIGMKLNLIPAGEFMMGSPESEEGRANGFYDGKAQVKFNVEQQHRVRITKPFYLATTEVTQVQWEAVMGTTQWTRSELVRNELVAGRDYPAGGISWHDAVEYCRRLTAKDGRSYRLPTEAEWEYACRAGSSAAYCFGDSADQLHLYARHYSPNRVGDNVVGIVGEKRANRFGLYDMHGNVQEWCADWFGGKYYAASPVNDPPGPSTGDMRVTRGGFAKMRDPFCRSAFRWHCPPEKQLWYIGFRVVSEVQPAHAAMADATVPKLISPANGAVLPNGPPLDWQFEWSPVPGASEYEIFAAHFPKSTNTQVSQAGITDTHYRFFQEMNYLKWEPIKDWRWKVRAKVQGKWKPWSPQRAFEVKPMTTEDEERLQMASDYNHELRAPWQPLFASIIRTGSDYSIRIFRPVSGANWTGQSFVAVKSTSTSDVRLPEAAVSLETIDGSALSSAQMEQLSRAAQPAVMIGQDTPLDPSYKVLFAPSTVVATCGRQPLGGAPSQGQQKVTHIRTPIPLQFATISSNATGYDIETTTYGAREVIHQVPETRTREENGKTVSYVEMVERIHQIMAPVAKKKRLPFAAVQFQSTDGRTGDPAVMKRHLRQPRMAVIAEDKLDTFYKSVFAPRTIIIKLDKNVGGTLVQAPRPSAQGDDTSQAPMPVDDSSRQAGDQSTP